MVQFAELYPAPEILSTVSKELSWSHMVELLPVHEKIKRELYTEMCRTERWNVRVLRKMIDGILYERTALSKRPDRAGCTDFSFISRQVRITIRN